MRRSLAYFRRTNLAILTGAAVTTSVLTGALLVGDSMRGSLRSITLERLGSIDYAFFGQQFFREELAEDLKGAQDATDLTSPLILVVGNVRNSTSGIHASRVNILGVDERFFDFYDRSQVEEPREILAEPAGPFAPALLNESLQKELQVEVGDAVLVYLERPSEVPPEFVLGSRDPSDLLRSLRVEIAGVVPDKGMGRFSLHPHQNLPLNLFLPLGVLQQALDQPERVNALVVSRAEGPSGNIGDQLNLALAGSIRLDDFGLRLRDSGETVVVESRQMLLSDPLQSAVEAAAARAGASFLRVYTYLANSLRLGGREIPYSTVSGIEASAADRDLPLFLTTGEPAPLPRSDEILLNRWAASQLDAKVGQTSTLRYFTVGQGEQLVGDQADFVVSGIVDMRGLGSDRTLTPQISGVQDAERMADWDPPIPIDLSRIRPQDEEYWEEFGATPKAFVNYQQAVKLWGSRFGSTTSVRVIAPETDVDFSETLPQFLLEEIEAGELGFRFQAVKEAGLRAAGGATDFGMLFIGFSFFLIVSSVLLVGLLFRLMVEQRSKEVGLRLALGYRLKAVKKQFILEGIIIAGCGVLVGLLGAVGYAWLMIVGLSTLWSAAVGPSFLGLHVGPSSLIIGLVCSLAVVGLSIWWAVRTLAQIPAPALLAGVKQIATASQSPRATRFLFWSSSTLAVVSLAVGAFIGVSQLAVFFAVGTLLLVAGLSSFSLWLKKEGQRALSVHDRVVRLRIAARNSARNPARSLLSAGLIASASFVIVAVGANRHQPGEELRSQASGAGGYSLRIQTDVPLHQDLNDPAGLFDLGFSDSQIEKLRDVRFQSLRLLPGQDVSCLNLYQPEKPRVLGVPDHFIRKGGFQFQSLAEDVDNPWTLLQGEIEPGVIPAFGDVNSMMWILHLSLGDDVILLDERGRELRLRLVGLLTRSIFQSEVMISEANFLKYFPSQSGYSYLLGEVAEERQQSVVALLENQMAPYGLDARATTEVLAGYLAVENTYLSTFQTLGGLGLLLGTLGLGVVLVRNVLERQGELATMRAFGFRRNWLAWMVMVENGFLLVLGLGLGTASAMVAVAPHLFGTGPEFPWVSLGLTLLAVLVVGLSAGVVAVRAVLRISLLPALRAE